MNNLKYNITLYGGEKVKASLSATGTYENFRYSFTARLMDFIVSNIEAKEDYVKLLEEPDALSFVDEYVSWKVVNKGQQDMGQGYQND